MAFAFTHPVVHFTPQLPFVPDFLHVPHIPHLPHIPLDKLTTQLNSPPFLDFGSHPGSCGGPTAVHGSVTVTPSGHSESASVHVGTPHVGIDVGGHNGGDFNGHNSGGISIGGSICP